MAYGQFTGYEPLPDMPGAYNFQTADGKALTFGGPEADQLKARLDAANAQTMTADNSGGVGGFDAGAAVRDLTGGAPPPPAAPTPQGPGGQLGYGLSVSPRGTIQKFAPGSAGVSREQLQKADANAVAVRRGETEAVQQGTPQDQDYLGARANMNVDQRMALQTQGDREMVGAQEEADVARQQFEQQQRLQAEEASRQSDLQAKYGREEQLKNKAFAEYSSSKVDPNRIFGGAGGKFLGALAAGIGAYAATIAKTPNYAQQIIDGAIDRDIRAQEAAIRVKGDKANNLLSDLRQTGMSIEQSRAVARGIQLNYTQAQTAAARAKNAVPALQSHYDNLDVALQNSLLEANEQSRLASVDKVSRQTAKGFEHERAATRGGMVDVADQLGTASKVQGLQKGEADIAKANRDTAKGGNASPEKRQAFSAIADAADLEKKLGKYGDGDVPPAGKRGIIGKTAAGAYDAAFGPGSTERDMQSEGERNMTSDYAEAQQTLGALASVLGGQGALSGAEAESFKAGMAPGGTMGEVKRAIAKLRSRAETKLQAADAAGEAGGVLTK